MTAFEAHIHAKFNESGFDISEAFVIFASANKEHRHRNTVDYIADELIEHCNTEVDSEISKLGKKIPEEEGYTEWLEATSALTKKK